MEKRDKECRMQHQIETLEFKELEYPELELEIKEIEKTIVKEYDIKRLLLIMMKDNLKLKEQKYLEEVKSVKEMIDEPTLAIWTSEVKNYLTEKELKEWRYWDYEELRERFVKKARSKKVSWYKIENVLLFITKSNRLI